MFEELSVSQIILESKSASFTEAVIVIFRNLKELLSEAKSLTINH